MSLTRKPRKQKISGNRLRTAEKRAGREKTMENEDENKIENEEIEDTEELEDEDEATEDADEDDEAGDDDADDGSDDEDDESDDDDEDEESDDDDDDEKKSDREAMGKRAQKRIGKLTGEIKDLKRELEDARKLSGDDGKAILSAAETAGILPQLMSAEEAKGIQQLDSKTGVAKYLKKLLRSDDDEFEIGGETRSRRWVQGELDDLQEEIGDLREKYGKKRTELAEKSKKVFELGMAAMKAGWKPGENKATKTKKAKKAPVSAGKKPKKGLERITKKSRKGEINWGDVTDEASMEAALLAEMEN